MTFFGLFGKKNKDDERNKDNVKSASLAATDASTINSIEQAAKTFTKPTYNPNTRKTHYDDPSAHERFMRNTFSEDKTVRDPYTGAELRAKQRNAKVEFGEKWEDHAAEADHIKPLNKIAKEHQKDAWTTTDDIREVANADENFQALARSTNRGSKDLGKGGDTQEEWAKNKRKMKGLKEKNELGESERAIKERIKKTGKEAEDLIEDRLFSKKIKNIRSTAHNAGIEGAKYGGVAGITASSIYNITSVIKGEKSSTEALKAIAIDGGKAAATGYVMGAGMTVVSHTLASSSSGILQALGKNNVPGKVINAVMVTGGTLVKWGNGEISTGECIRELGEKGTNIAVSSYAAVAGQALIPIPVVGATIGAVVGSMLTDYAYGYLKNYLETKKLEHEERMRIIAECEKISRQAREYRAELEQYIESYFQEYKACFDEALSAIHLSFKNGDANGVIAGANQITRKLGGSVKYENTNEFRAFLRSDEVDTF